MKWFKHQSTARNDERIAQLEDKAGLEGYGFYFKLLEIVAEVIDSSDRHEVTYSISRWGRQTNITTKKFLFLVQCCHDVGLMSAQRVGDSVIVKIPNLLKFRDNHTKNLQATYKQDKEKEKEKEKDIETDIKAAATKVADHLAIKIKNYTPTAIPKPHTWIEDIDKAMRIDRRTEEDLMEIIDWTYSGGGDFWIPTIRSGRNLREKYDTMFSQMKGEKKIKPAPWFLSCRGIEAKAEELNITLGEDEPFPYFKARVLTAAGVSTTDSQKGKMALRALTGASPGD